MKTDLHLLGAVWVLSALATCAHATVTNVAWYRLGENDPGAASGLAVTNTTTDLLGLHHARQVGSPRYTNAVSPSASNGLGSSLAVHFSGTNQFFTNAIVSTATNNFGVEAWVKPNNTNAGFTYFIVQNGFTYAGSWSITQAGSYFGGFSDTNTGYGVGDGTAIASPGVWAHVALVRNNGTNRFYFNGVTNGPPTTNAPIQPSGHFTIGANFGFPPPGTVSNSFFPGTIDEVRVFTFAPGQFSTNDLLFNAQRAVTLPATAVNPSNATLNGSAHPVGFPTSAWFEWGTTTNYGNVTPTQSFGSDAGTTNFSQVVNGTTVGVTYHFRAVASNSLGLAFGADQSFSKPVFEDIGAGLPGVAFSSVAWGDYDNDGRLDILLTGSTGFTNKTSQIWRNTASGFTNINAGLTNILFGSAAWGDFNNDGSLDILLAGATRIGTNGFTTAWAGLILRNTNGSFVVTSTNIAPIPGADLGDYDNDGRLDLLFPGGFSVWRNTGVGFTNILGFPSLTYSSAAWGDYDNDGRLDVLLTGNDSLDHTVSQVWRNTGAGFTNINAGLTGVMQGSVAWGDYDNDGRLDILLTGATNSSGNSGAISQVWRNTGSGFTNINAGLPGVLHSSVAWGDFDNDGRLDIVLTGATGQSNVFPIGFISQIWRNTGNGFTNLNANLPGVTLGSVALGDYDNDGRLDILLTGGTSFEPDTFLPITAISQILRNNLPVANTLPTAPTGLLATLTGNVVTLSWNSASDAQTPASGLSYNVRIGTTPGGSDVLSPMSAANGYRRRPALGNAEQGLTAVFASTLGTPYYWSVQAVDSAFAGSAFSAEQNFKLLQWEAPVVVTFATATNLLVGDYNGNGAIDEDELNIFLANYFPNSPFLYMTNVAGLGGTNVTFALTNSFVGAFSVEYSTNLVDWYFLGPATPRYLFTDTNAPALPQRYYRLRYP